MALIRKRAARSGAYNVTDVTTVASFVASVTNKMFLMQNLCILKNIPILMAFTAAPTKKLSYFEILDTYDITLVFNRIGLF